MKVLHITFLMLLTLLTSVSTAKSAEEIDFDNYQNMALKVASKSEIVNSPNSNTNEFLNIKELTHILGEEKQNFDTRFIYLSNKDIMEENTKSTWQYLTKTDGKKVYSLLYKRNRVSKQIKNGDLLFIGKTNDKLDIIILKRNSDYAASLLGILNLDGSKNLPKNSLPEAPVINTPKDTGKLVLIGIPTKYNDGSNFTLDKQFNIKMFGLEVPDVKQVCKYANGKYYTCGNEATNHLKSLISGKRITCIHIGWNEYNNLLYTCYNYNNADLSQTMVAHGQAVSDQSQTYIEAEKQAKEQKKGLWQGYFLRPSEWRQAKSQ